MESLLKETAKLIDPLFIHLFKYLLRADPKRIEKGLGRTHLEVLRALQIGEEDGDTLSSSVIAERLLISRAYTTSLIDKLVGLELVKRIPDSQDRRFIWIEMTGKGRKELEERARMNRENYEKRLASLTDEDRTTLYWGIRNVVEILEKIGTEDKV